MGVQQAPHVQALQGRQHHIVPRQIRRQVAAAGVAQGSCGVQAQAGEQARAQRGAATQLDSGDLVPPPEPSPALPREYETLTAWSRFDDWFQRLQAAELVAIDTETDSLDGMRARIVGDRDECVPVLVDEATGQMAAGWPEPWLDGKLWWCLSPARQAE